LLWPNDIDEVKHVMSVERSPLGPWGGGGMSSASKGADVLAK